MSQPTDNPYQPPQTSGAGSAALPDNAGLGLREKVKRFRQQMHALGVFWILCGLVNAASAVYFPFLLFTTNVDDTELPREFLLALIGISAIVAIVWLAAGVLTLRKQLGAVTAGLVLSYLTLAMALLGVNVCGIVLLVMVVIQGHRVLRWGKELQAAGIPLTTRPQDLPETDPPSFALPGESA